MSNTRRKEPASPCYLKRQRHVPYRRAEEMAEDEVDGLPARHRNRIAARRTRIANPWDDKTVSEFRGQPWHRRNLGRS